MSRNTTFAMIPFHSKLESSIVIYLENLSPGDGVQVACCYHSMANISHYKSHSTQMVTLQNFDFEDIGFIILKARSINASDFADDAAV